MGIFALNTEKQHPGLYPLITSQSEGTLCYAKVDHADTLQEAEQAKDFPAEQLQSVFLQRLVSCLPADTPIEHFALGEFSWLLKPSHNCHEVCAKTLAAFRQRFDYDNYQAFVTLSISNSDITRNADRNTTILELKHALRSAQAQGGDRCYQARARRDVLSQLPSAIEREEFSIYFQGVWSADNGQMKGAEALLRWHGMDINNIDPAQLIRLAEEGGKMSSLGNWIIQKACSSATGWLENWASPLSLGLNISAQQFRSANFVTHVIQCLENTWLEPTVLELEIRYAEFLPLLENSANDLQTLTNLGVRICLDNIDEAFFSGEHQNLRDALLGKKDYISSSSAGLTLNISSLKFSPGLIIQHFSSSENTLDKRCKNTVEQFVADCKKTHIRTTAVGVENEEILKEIRQSGFDLAQGYLLGKPLNATAFNRFAKTQGRQNQA